MTSIAAIILLSSFFYHLSLREVESVTWSRFVTSLHYKNLKLVSELNPFTPIYFPQEKPLAYLRMECSKYCATHQFCYAFNLYPTDSSYVCELLPDNLCVDRTNKVFLDWPGNEIWDKINLGMTKSCIETRFPPPTNITCAVIKPGCLGTWPNCTNCLRSCKDCYDRQPLNSQYDCTFWPDGPAGLHIFGKCVWHKTYLIKHVVNLAAARNDVFYQLSFYDMKRMQLQKDLTWLEFHFITSGGSHHWVRYVNFDLDTNGTLLNLTYYDATPVFDMFNLKTRTPGPISYVNVTDDRFGCGSFWLLDPSNATYCPGGGVRMLGTLQTNGNQVVSTGMRYPTLPASAFITYASMEIF